MEKAKSLSFPMVPESGGPRKSLHNEILVGAKRLKLSLPNFVIGRLYSVLYKSIFGASDKVRCDTCDKARPLSQV